MTVRRKHSDVLLAVLIIVGVCIWLSLVERRVVPSFSTPVQFAGLFVGAFAAAHIARRLLVDLELGATVIAAPLAIALALGIFAQHHYMELRLDLFAPLGIATAGALVGAFT